MMETIDLQIDTQDLTNEVRAISNTVTDIHQNVAKLESDIARFSDIADRMVSEIRAEVKSLNSVATEIVNSIISVLTTISDTIDKILESGEKPDWLNIANTALQAYATLGSQNKSGIPSTGKKYIGKYESGGTSVFGGAEGNYTANKGSSASGIVGGLGDMSSMLPDEAMLQGLVDMIGKLKESAAAWIAQTGAKIADKAVDLQIIALYVVDYVKAFGAAVAQIAASTAAWIANTAAKVASTAAEWAQIAATTAWNALCAVATTVTTAFGAAMAFLTSPIGLVVVAVTALITVIVLLVKNWDTVKAAAISVWESIKSAFGTAAAWFNTTVVEPVSRFFSGLWEGFLQAASNAWEGVKSVFSAVAGFFGDIFSTAWEKVVSVFSAGVQSIMLHGTAGRLPREG